MSEDERVFTDSSALRKFVERTNWPVRRPCPEPDCTQLLPLEATHRHRAEPWLSWKCPVHGYVRYEVAS